jgi:hypothetical protein
MNFFEFFWSMVSDPVTIVFIVAALGVFRIGYKNERTLTTSYLTGLAVWEELCQDIARGAFLDNFEANQKEGNFNRRIDLVMRHFVCTKQGSTKFSVRYLGGLALLANPVSQTIPLEPTSPNRFFPALLTTIGVAGTFLGITLGLGDFSTVGDSARMMASATTLLSGMKTAFVTSLVGLTAGGFFMFLLGREQRLRHEKFLKTSSGLSLVAIALSPSALLHNLQSEGQEKLAEQQLLAAQSAKEVNEKLASTINELESSLKALSADELGATISEAIRVVVRNELAPTMAKIPEVLEELRPLHQSISEMLSGLSGDKLASQLGETVGAVVRSELKPPLDALPQAVDELKQIKADTGRELINLLTASLRADVIEPLVSEVHRVNETVVSTTTSVEKLSDGVNAMMNRLTATTDTLNEFQRDTLTKLSDFAASLKGILEEFNRDTAGTLEGVSTAINNALHSAIQGMEIQRDAFEASADKAAKAFGEQNSTLRLVGENAKNLMDDARENLLQGLGGIDEKVKLMASAVQSELEQFRLGYQENLTQFFSQQESLLEQTMGKQRDGLAAVVTDFKSVFEDEYKKRAEQYTRIADIHENLSISLGAVQQLMEAVGWTETATLNQLDAAARSVSAQVGKLQLTYEDAGKTFSNVIEKMPVEMESYFAKSRSVNEQFFSNFDEAAYKVHASLADAANLLVSAMQKLETQWAEKSNLRSE